MRSVGELLEALGPDAQIQLHQASAATPIGQLAVDSRVVEPGACFIATRGLTHDAHAFVGRVVAAGAALLILERDVPAASETPRILVADTAELLPLLAAAWHGWPGEQLVLAGITGTNGKTSVAHLLGSILEAAGRLYVRLGTTGNWLVDREIRAGYTTPFPLEMQALLADASERGATHGVMEVASHALVQHRARPLQFRAVALTSFSQDHLDFHETMEAYLEAKCELAREACHPEGLAVAPTSQGAAAQRFLRVAAEAGVARCWRCSRDPVPPDQAELAVLTRESDAAGFCGRIRTPAGEIELRSGLVGDHNLDNLMIAIAVALGLDIDLDAIALGLAGAGGAPGRLEAVRRAEGEGPLVYVDYAHTPDAVARVLEALRPIARQRGGQLIVLVGCGGDRDVGKRPLMAAFASQGADRFYATSDNPRSEDPEAILDAMLEGLAPGGAQLIREVDRAAAIARAIADAKPEDVVLLAGKGHEDYQIVGTQKLHFDDREHAMRALGVFIGAR